MTHYRKGHRVRRKPIFAEEMEDTDELFGHDGFSRLDREQAELAQALGFVDTVRELRPNTQAALMQQRGVG